MVTDFPKYEYILLTLGHVQGLADQTSQNIALSRSDEENLLIWLLW